MRSAPAPLCGPEAESLSWSAKDRDRALDQAEAGEFDLIIIGGGITGAGVAREAALRRIPFLLVDKEDFAFGTSSRSSKLVHGGFRYLAQGEFRLVRESTTERNWLRQALPNLVRPLGFHFCAYDGGKDTPARVRASIVLYDLLSNVLSPFKNAPHRFLTPAELAAREPAVSLQGLLMAGLYFDTLVDDGRLVLETLKEARDASGGLSVALNYVKAARIVTGPDRAPAVLLEDRLGGRRFTARAGCVLNATGVWTDATLGLAGAQSRMIRPTKGVHLVVPNARLGNRDAFVLRSLDDGRSFFVLRRGEVSVIGTTDTDYPGDPDRPWCERQDCDYLLRTVNRVFPEARLTPDDILSTSAGIRPLVKVPAQGKALAKGGNESSVSRRHLFLDSGHGLVTIAGGKLTTFRTMAWETLARCSGLGYLRRLRGREARRNFSRRPFKHGMTWEAWQRAAGELGLDRLVPQATARHLHQQYGQQSLRILAEVARCPAAGEPLLEGHPFCAAEILHILAFENAPRLTDVMLRRTEMQMLVSHRRQPELAGRVAGIMASFYGWDPDRLREELERYLEHVRNTVIR
jgi:glycerol-3-phosphate dehydrogenase